ncbi:MAG: AAA family ATPase, partial [Acidimicrobiia bacterium]
MKREEWADIRRRHRQGAAIKQIARDKGISRNTVRRALAADEPPTRRARGPVGSAIDPYEPRIVELLLSEPEVSAADIARRIGWGRSLTVLKDRVRTLRRDLPKAGREDTPKRGRPLPAELTSFVGRSTELACIAGLLETARVVSLTGPGGVGKTRLAIRAASTARHHFADGTCMAQLGSLRDPALLVETLLDDFGITDPAGSASEPINRLVDHLQGRQVLLLLDNCEHLVQDVARLVTTLLESAAGLNVLATSRERLGIPGEHVVIVAPLELAPAVALFADRAAAALPGFAVTDENRRLVTQLCRGLDGIPLAIELATVRLRALSLEDLLSHLDHRFAVLTQGSPAAPARHRTLETTIDWSFELCTGHERALWTRASVFAGGFDVAAATAVCADATLPAGAVLDGVAGLVAKSILVREEEAGQVRFRMLETIRELGQERLPAAEQRGLSIRHRDWCLDLVERCAAEWFGPDQIKWTRRLRREQANLRAALEHALTQGGGISVALRLVGGPWFLWATAFSLTEHRRWLHRALDASTGHEPERATALATCGLVASLQGDQPAAGALAAESLDLAGELSQPTAIAYATHVLGLVDFFSGDAGRAEARLGECLSSYQALGVGDDLVGALHVHLGLLFISRGELERAEAHLDEMRPRCEARGERWIRSYVLDGLGFVALARGDLG